MGLGGWGRIGRGVYGMLLSRGKGGGREGGPLQQPYRLIVFRQIETYTLFLSNIEVLRKDSREGCIGPGWQGGTRAGRH